MLYLMIVSTAVYALSALYGTATDALFFAASFAVVCAWLPRMYYGFVFSRAGSLLERILRGNKEPQEFADDAMAKVANRIWQMSLVAVFFLAVFLMLGYFNVITPVEHPTLNGGWSEMHDLEKRFVLLWCSSLAALVCGMLDSRMQWERGHYEYQMAQQFEDMRARARQS